MNDPLGILKKTQLPKEYAFDREYAEHEAFGSGLDIVDADDYTLQLDFDNAADYQEFIGNRCGMLLNFVDVKKIYSTMSRSGNTHVYIEMQEPLPAYARIALQAALGSDPVRELLNTMRIREGTEKPIFLFETKDAPYAPIYERDTCPHSSTPLLLP